VHPKDVGATGQEPSPKSKIKKKRVCILDDIKRLAFRLNWPLRAADYWYNVIAKNKIKSPER
jgi:hypothetical protein